MFALRPCRPAHRPICKDAGVAGPMGTLKMAQVAWQAWNRLPPAQRRALLQQARRHGPKVAALAVTIARETRDRRREPPAPT